MIVQCKKLFNEITNVYGEGKTDGFLTIGNHYNVLEIYFSPEKIYYRVCPDGDNYYRHSVLVRSDDFDLITEVLPANWRINKVKDNKHKLGPPDWNTFDGWEESFWQDWDNNLPRAQYVYERDLKIILDCDPEYIDIIKKERNMI